VITCPRLLIISYNHYGCQTRTKFRVIDTNSPLETSPITVDAGRKSITTRLPRVILTAIYSHRNESGFLVYLQLNYCDEFIVSSAPPFRLFAHGYRSMVSFSMFFFSEVQANLHVQLSFNDKVRLDIHQSEMGIQRTESAPIPIKTQPNRPSIQCEPMIIFSRVSQTKLSAIETNFP